jgi:transcriptional regulator with XRE-family HTH domain
MTLDQGIVRVPTWTIGDLLRKAREHAGLEQMELAEELGISRATVSNYERGHVRPRKAVVMAWAMRTGVPVAWLQTGGNPRQGDGPDGGSTLPRLDSNQQPFGYTEAEVIELRPALALVEQEAA